MSLHTEVNEPDCVKPLLVCEKIAARMIGVSPSLLVARRFRKQPLLPFIRIGKRSIRYRVADIEDFVQRCTAEGGSS
jgi:hypothetical protein